MCESTHATFFPEGPGLRHRREKGENKGYRRGRQDRSKVNVLGAEGGEKGERKGTEETPPIIQTLMRSRTAEFNLEVARPGRRKSTRHRPTVG
eukprot:3922249-Pyramimonas_sp.AAC.1